MRSATREVKLFRNGRNQALRIPREFELEGSRVLVHREGDRLIVQPLRKGRLLIAAHALALGLTVVSGDDREFARVPGLAVENWLSS